MLRSGTTPHVIDRAELGHAAFLRGESLRRAGFLEAVETDLRYALSELEGANGAEGWQYRTRIALLALSADRGQDVETLPKINDLFHEIKQTLGVESFASAEAASLVSKLLLRNGDIVNARKTAEEAAAAAAQSLSPEHSLTIQLNLLVAEALLASGDSAGAARTAARAIGLTALPEISSDDDKVLWQKLAATNDIHERVAIIRSALELPGALDNRSVLQRRERIRAARILRQATAMTDAEPWHFAAVDLAIALAGC